MQWFRFYGDAVNDPKVQSLTGDQFKFWVNLLCVASKNKGTIKISELPFTLRMDEAAIRLALGSLEALNLLVRSNQHADCITPNGWNKRQYKSDVSTERVKRFRNVAETPPEQIQKQNRTPIVPRGDFKAFYSAYPKRISPKDAERAYLKALKSVAHEEIMAGVIKYASHVAGTERQYIQAPAAWLNKGRWADDYGTPQSAIPDWIKAQR